MGNFMAELIAYFFIIILNVISGHFIWIKIFENEKNSVPLEECKTNKYIFHDKFDIMNRILYKVTLGYKFQMTDKNFSIIIYSLNQPTQGGPIGPFLVFKSVFGPS